MSHTKGEPSPRITLGRQIRSVGSLVSICILGTWLGATAASACDGDCNVNAKVTVDELVVAVNIALGAFEVDQCAGADSSDDGEVTIDELLGSVNAALEGCPMPTPAPTATSTPAAMTTATHAPTATTTTTVSFMPTPTSSPADAATTTPTSTATPSVAVTPEGVARTCVLAGSSQVTFQAERMKVDINLTGSQIWRFGAARPDGTRDVFSLAGDSHFDCLAADVSGVLQVAACVRMDPATQGRGVVDCAGGQITDGYDVVASVDHNTSDNAFGFPQDAGCVNTFTNPDGSIASPCREGLGASCSGTSNVHLGVCNSAAHLDQSGAFPAGGLRMTQTFILRPFLKATCTAALCPPDTTPFDAAAGDVRVTADMTSGGAKGVIFDFLSNGLHQVLGTTGSGDGPSICGLSGADACVTSATGAPYTAVCADVSAGGLNTGRLVTALTVLDLPLPIYDVVATIGITCQ